MTNDCVIDVQHLQKKFDGKLVLKDISLRVKQGEVYGFLGPNGSGKTTTIRMLCGLLTPDGGSGTCLGYDIIKQAEAIKLNVGYMSQHFSLYDDLTIQENLDFIARVYQLKNRKQCVEQSLEQLGLKNRANQLAMNLSGGWKQRLALACAMIHQPKLLLLDEPTAGVDPQARCDFWDRIHGLAAQGVTVLVSTHYMDEAERCSELVYITQGKVLSTGTIDEIVAAAHLTVWEVRGAHLYSLLQKLQMNSAVDQVNMFGNLLHVCSHDEAAIDQLAATYASQPEYQWQKIDADLEDVFITLVSDYKKTTHQEEL
jgi:ABC-2 type transport system ATP-binding protein